MAHRTCLPIAAVAVLALACSSTKREDVPPVSFATSTEAFNALVEAARDGAVESFEPLLGPRADEIVASGDPVALRNEFDAFVELYEAQHRVEEDEDGAARLLVGANDWPFPIPLVRSEGGWSFDADAGMDEVLSRRIGRNELDAIEVVRAIGDAQEEVRAASGAYAARILSGEGQRDGLYWPTAEDEAPSPLGQLAADAAMGGYTRAAAGERTPYVGYHFRILAKQGPNGPGGAAEYAVDGRLTGGYAVLAWPAEYGASGVMTFIMDRRGVVLERDLGPDTDSVALAMEAYDPSAEWGVCVD